MDRNEELFARAQKVIPGGVNSPVRAFGSVGGTPFFVARGGGPYVVDAAGTRYIDYVQSYGAVILGHAHPAVVGAVGAAAAEGTTFGFPTEREVKLAEVLTSRVEGCDLVRLVSSGTEATMSAIRLARGFTGRDRIVKFAGCYHGHSDSLLAAAGSGVATFALPDSAGVPKAAVADTTVVPYNEVPEVDTDVAAVIVEPAAANMGLVPPAPGFLEGLRAACDRAGTLLIFDEVITGFRVAPGGASQMLGVVPDLWTFGKVIGGGLPVGAFGGRRDVMERLTPAGPVYQAGTLSGNPLATAAGLAALECLDSEAYVALVSTASTLAAGLDAAFADAGVAAQVPVFGPILGIFFSDTPVTNYDEANAACGTDLYSRFFHGMLDRGIALAPGPYEAMFPGLAHTSTEIDATIAAAASVAPSLRT